MNRKDILTKLKKVIDPELRINIVDLGLVYDVKVKNSRVDVLMTLTSPACPLAAVFKKMVMDKVKELAGVKEVNVRLTFEPIWGPERMSEKARIELGILI